MSKSKRANYANCCVPQCTSKSSKDLRLSFHKFPNQTDPREEKRRAEWIRVLRIDHPVTKKMVVCSKHFKKQDYFLPDVPTRRPYLKNVVIPTLFLPEFSPEIKKEEMENKKHDEIYSRENSSIWARIAEDHYMLPPSCDHLATNLYSTRMSSLRQLLTNIDDSKEEDTQVAQHSEIKPRLNSMGQRMKKLNQITTENKKQRNSELRGRRIVDISFFIRQIQEMSDHGSASCSFRDMVFVCETQQGFNSGLKFRCQTCSLSKTIWTDTNSDTKQRAPVNEAAITGIIAIGGNYSGLRTFSDYLSIPCLSPVSYNTELGLMEQESKARNRMAKDAAKIVDKTWRMVSYGENFRSFSGQNLKSEVVPEPQPSLVNELEPNTLLRPVQPTDLIVEMDPEAMITPDIVPPDESEPGPSSRMEPDSSMMDLDQALTCEIYPADVPEPNLLLHIKNEPIDPDTYRQDILSATVVQELNSFSNESSITSNQVGSLFQPPVLIKEEPVSSEEDL